MYFITIKSFKAAAIAIIYAQVAFSAPADVISAQEDVECGSLRVIKVNNATLPANIDRNDIRKCAGHPVDSEEDKQGRLLLGKMSPRQKVVLDSKHWGPWAVVDL
ncbi:hypothetical protein MHUMG1_09776 [Metarhizium humberi]|uniref:Uncharacterized protein n=1 Tax=Metarhizium humberi TaxID=2596975 RepID=A0A9P8S3P7_9HYPO|nr:hypothetical protein MHUMG1_09776 [Metarhizium humberi]